MQDQQSVSGQAHGWQQTCIVSDKSDGVIYSKQANLFLKFIFFPLSKAVKGRHGHAKHSVELLRGEVPLRGEETEAQSMNHSTTSILSKTI